MNDCYVWRETGRSKGRTTSRTFQETFQGHNLGDQTATEAEIVGEARDVAPIRSALTRFKTDVTTDVKTDNLTWFCVQPAGVIDIYLCICLHSCVKLYLCCFFVSLVSIISDPI